MYVHKLQGRFVQLKFAIEKSLLLEKNWVETLSTLIVFWNLRTEIARSSHNLMIWTQLDFRTRFSREILPRFLSSISQSLFFYFCCAILLKIINSRPLSGILVDQIDRKCCWCQHASKINLISLQLYLLHFPFNVIIEIFLLEAEDSFLKIIKSVFTSDFESWLTKCGKISTSVALSWYYK